MEKNRIRCLVAVSLLGGAVVILLSLVCVTHSVLPSGEAIEEWVWFDKAAILAAVCILFGLLCHPRKSVLRFSDVVSWTLIIWGGVEAVWGVRQLYGFATSSHSLYALTGSFFNPGPYSGYLAMVFPVCLHQYLACGKEEKLRQNQHDGCSWGKVVWWGKRMLSGGAMLLILCVLPAGMSRSAWLAAGISGLCIYGCQANWKMKIQSVWQWSKRWVIIAATGGLCVLILAGCLLFTLKADSARGRLFMWKITCHAIAEKPLSGYGTGSFATVYGDAQEAYFATGDYEPWEERVAGSPEYAFNEYLQAAVEFGIPLTFCLLAVILICLYIGVRKGRYGICGALFSLMIFSFFSYPLQLPVFIVTFLVLLLACFVEATRWEWLGVAIWVGVTGSLRLGDDLRTKQACREWMNARILYNAGACESAGKDYERLYPLLKGRAAFLFEYGHGLHKQQQFELSNRILKDALKHSCDPMILNILGKNSQGTGDYRAAEKWFIRSTHRLPGRIYPYYLLVKLYAEPGFRQPEKLEEMKHIVLTKEPKVNSTAIREMREEVKKIYIGK